MFYRITSDDKTIYDTRTPLEGFKVVNPTITFSEDASGKLEFTVPPMNISYDIPKILASVIKVYKNDTEIWEGRIITEERDFIKNRKCVCEGEMGYLNDTIQPIEGYEMVTPREYLNAVIAIHNAKVTADRRFTVGDVTVIPNKDDEDPELVGKIEYIYTNFESTLTSIKNLADKYEGHIRVEKRNGVRYIDFLAEEYDRQSDQAIHFGRNLLDFTQNWDLTDLATVVIPLGASLDNSLVEGATDYVNIEDINDGKNYVYSQSAVEEYGWIETVVHFDDEDDLYKLKEKGEKYLSESQFTEMTIQCSAVDLSNLGTASDEFNLRDYVRVISEPHGLDKYFTVTSVTLHLDDLSQNEYTLGKNEKQSLSSRTVEANHRLEQMINAIPPEKSTLRKAQEASADMVLNATTGKITLFKSDDGTEMFVISQERIPETITNLDELKAWSGISHFWIWNMNGFGYFVRQANGEWRSDVAMDFQGRFNANFITTGILTSILIRNGTPNAQGVYPFSVDQAGNLYAHSADIKGTISGSDIIGSTFRNANRSFFIDSSGNIVGATFKNANGSFYIDSSGNIVGATFKNANGSFYINSAGDIVGANITGARIATNNNNFVAAADGKARMRKAMAIDFLEVQNESQHNSVYLRCDTTRNELSFYTDQNWNSYAKISCGSIASYDIDCTSINCTSIKCNEYDITECRKIELKRQQGDKEPNGWLTAHWYLNDFIGVHQNAAGAEAANDYITIAAADFAKQSDSRLKNIIDIDNEKMIDIIMSLEPVVYTWNENTSGDHERQHMGFIAQDVNELLKSILGENGNGLVQLGTDGDDMSFTYGLSYSEFAAPLVYTVQQQQKKIDSLEERIAKLEALIDKL